MEKSQRKSKVNRGTVILLEVVLGITAFCAFCFFIFFNNKTRKTVQLEREDYVIEVAGQLTRNIENMQKSYVREVEENVESLSAVRPSDYGTLKQMYSDRAGAKHLLISQEGVVYDIDGNKCTLSDEAFAYKINSENLNDGVVMTYATINTLNDYILFGEKISPVTISGTTYVAWVVGVTSDYFRENMTVSLFDGIGAGYLIATDGSIIIKPSDNSMVFSGYNLFSSLQSGGVSAEDLQKIEGAVASGESRTMTVNVSGVNWLITFKSTSFDSDYIVVAVPLTLTAADTYHSMNLTVLFAFIFIVSLALIMGMILLLTFRRKREEDKRAAATDAQTVFLSKMSHDIRTPLNAVIGMLMLAQDSGKSRREIDDFILKARESADYLLELINDMLDLQKINCGKMELSHEAFSLTELLNGIESMYAPILQEKKLDFTVENMDKSDMDYIGDRTKIKRIIMNLLSNSMKFTNAGGKVTLLAQQNPLEDGRAMVTITLSDTGIGMSDEFQKRIFRPFEQERDSGTSGYMGSGLGLHIVKSLVELMGGSISVKSKINEGSTFIIRLPLERGEKAALPPQTKAVVPFHNERVLLAEDNAINQQIAVMILSEKLMLSVDAVDNGLQAVEAVDKSPLNTYAAIILDVRMPVMDGLKAAKSIRALERADAKTVPIIALSANTFEENIKSSLAAGMNAHLAKPIDIGELSATLHKFLD